MAIKKILPILRQKRGFTIIEVVLVLAIAGLIFLMVFVALPALQRSQRDAQRRNDIAQFAAALENKRINNNGVLRFTDNNDGAARLLFRSINGGLSSITNGAYDPSGELYKVIIRACSDRRPINQPLADLNTGEKCTTDTLYTNKEQQYENSNGSPFPIYPLKELTFYVLIITGAKCGQESSDGYTTYAGSGRNNFAILYKLEGSGIVCVDNS